MFVKIANREDTDQTALSEADLGLRCLSRPFWQATSDQSFRTFTVTPIYSRLYFFVDETCTKDNCTSVTSNHYSAQEPGRYYN